jgi:hypothetical protein
LPVRWSRFDSNSIQPATALIPTTTAVWVRVFFKQDGYVLPDQIKLIIKREYGWAIRSLVDLESDGAHTSDVKRLVRKLMNSRYVLYHHPWRTLICIS